MADRPPLLPPARLARNPDLKRLGCRCRGGFNLIELLGVIAIIALLASILLPVLNRAKLKATASHCLGNLKQLQLAWTMYTLDNGDLFAGNYGLDEASRVPNVGNWVSGWLDPRQPDNSDNTNTLLLLDPKYGALGPYTKSAGVYRCLASKATGLEGGSSYPVARTVSMSGWIGFRNDPWNSGYLSFHKTSDLSGISPSDTLVFMEERDDSIDDGEFVIDMVQNQLAKVPAGFHGGAGGVTFADGHADIHRWRTPEVLRPQPTGGQSAKWQLLPVTADNPDLLWLRNHATVAAP